MHVNFTVILTHYFLDEDQRAQSLCGKSGVKTPQLTFGQPIKQIITMLTGHSDKVKLHADLFLITSATYVFQS